MVVSVPALLSAQCYINKNIGRDQQRLIELLPKDKDGTITADLPDFRTFVREVLGWSNDDLVPFGEQYAELEVALPQYRETLQPTYVVEGLGDRDLGLGNSKLGLGDRDLGLGNPPVPNPQSPNPNPPNLARKGRLPKRIIR